MATNRRSPEALKKLYARRLTGNSAAGLPEQGIYPGEEVLGTPQPVHEAVGLASSGVAQSAANVHHHDRCFGLGFLHLRHDQLGLACGNGVADDHHIHGPGLEYTNSVGARFQGEKLVAGIFQHLGPGISEKVVVSEMKDCRDAGHSSPLIAGLAFAIIHLDAMVFSAVCANMRHISSCQPCLIASWNGDGDSTITRTWNCYSLFQQALDHAVNLA